MPQVMERLCTVSDLKRPRTIKKKLNMLLDHLKISMFSFSTKHLHKLEEMIVQSVQTYFRIKI